MNQVSKPVSVEDWRIYRFPKHSRRDRRSDVDATAVGLRMHDQNRLANLGRQRILAGERADPAAEHYVVELFTYHVNGVRVSSGG